MKLLPVCILCSTSNVEEYKKLKRFTYYKCKKCTGIFVNPIRTQAFYSKAKTYLTDPKDYAKFMNPYGLRWIMEEFEKLYEKKTGNNRGTLFEIGTGLGYLELFALARGWNVKGIETSIEAVKFANEYLRIDVQHSTIEDYVPDQTHDAIIMVEVLEHFLNPIIAFESVKKLGRKGTVIFGTTPNTDSSHWEKSEQDIYMPEDHIFLFNKKSLKKFAKMVGLKKVTIQYFGSGEKNDSNIIYAGII